jgi:D-alanine-D-alanine ligase
MRVIVLLGGNSPERDVSFVSGRAVGAALSRRGHTVTAVDTAGGRLVDLEAQRGIGVEPPSAALVPQGDAVRAIERLGAQAFGEVDVVFVALHGTGGEDGTIQALLDVVGVPYTGSGVMASSVAMDKELAKRVFRDVGVPTPAGFGAAAATPAPELVQRVGRECGWPAVVKPNSQGSSVGVGVAAGPEQLPAAVEVASAYDDRLLFEAFIPGREMTVAILQGKALPVVEIVPHSGVYDYRSKYTSGSSSYHVPANIPAAVARALQEHAETCFAALRCRDFARIDFRLSPANEPYCLEVNTIPGMTPTSLVPKAAQAAGIDFDTLVETILLAASARARVPSRGI